jgi:hypothetical protein
VLEPGKHGTYTVLKPDGKAEHAATHKLIIAAEQQRLLLRWTGNH